MSFFGPNNRARFDDNSGTSFIDRIAGIIQFSNDGGGTFSAVGSGGFGSLTQVPIANNSGADVTALEIQTSLTNSTPSSEASKTVFRLLKGGVQAPSGGFGVDTATLDPDTFTINSTTAKLSLLSDCQVYRDLATANICFTSNQNDMVQGSTSLTLATNTQFGFMQTTQIAGPPTATPARLIAQHAAQIYDIANCKWWNYSAEAAQWVASGDNFKLGANLTDANVSKDVSNGAEFVLPRATLTTGTRVLTLAPTSSPITGQVIRVTRYDTTANGYTVKDGSASTLLVFPGSVRAAADFKFNGAQFVLDRYWVMN